MSNWIDLLKGDAREWLQEGENPSVRYFTLLDILERKTTDPLVTAAKSRIMHSGVVPKILSGQNPGGYWERAEDFYIRTKYRGTVWQLIILAEMGADGRDPRLQHACEFILDWSQDRQSGGFAYRGSRAGGGNHSGVLPCLTGNMVWSLIRLGREKDSRVQHGIRWLTEFLRFDDGETRPPSEWPYHRWEQCWGRHTCIPGVVKALKAAAEIHFARRTPAVKKLISRGAEFMLRHHLFKRSHDLGRAAKPKWTRFGFPTMWDIDALEAADILLRLGIRDDRMQETMDLILSKQDDQGRWSLENTFNGRFRINIDRKGRPSKWVTLIALRVLKAFFGGMSGQKEPSS